MYKRQPQCYADLGFSIVFYTSSLFLRVLEVLEHTLNGLKQGEFPIDRPLPTFDQMTDIMGLPEWLEIGERYS